MKVLKELSMMMNTGEINLPQVTGETCQHQKQN